MELRGSELSRGLSGMGFNRDKAADLAATRSVISGASPAERTSGTWLDHRKGSKGYQLDLLLLKGVDDAALTRARQSWRNHIDHLRYEHGLEVERDNRGYWKITGGSDLDRVRRTNGEQVTGAADGVADGRKRKKITDEQYRRGYELGREVFEGEVDRDEAIAELVRIGANEVTASNMIYIVDGLLSGQIFKRALKDEAYGWYLGWILRDYRMAGLETALKSARLHLTYRESPGVVRTRLREIIKHYKRILNGEAPADAFPAVDDNDARGGRGTELRQAWVKLRYGQPEFRKKLLAAYGGRCAVTGTAVPEILEAAHIQGYAAEGESRVSNGILMRSDIHALFDAGLLGIEPETYRVKLSPELMGEEEYWKLNGKKIELPERADLYPNAHKLKKHLVGANLEF